MFPFADPFRFMQSWCEATTALTRAQMAAYEAVGAQMALFWAGTLPQPQARPTNWLDQWSALTMPRLPAFASPPVSTSFALPATAGIPFNPWAAAWGLPGSPFNALLAGLTEAMTRSALALAEAQAPPAHGHVRDARGISVVDAAYRGAGGHAMAPSIKFSAEVPVSTLAALASVWAWPWPTARTG